LEEKKLDMSQNESFKTWRARIEMRLVARFGDQGIEYWEARRAAMIIVEKTKSLRRLYNQDLSPAEAMTKLGL
jgi:membrane protein DedA with SNARE-associated domain